MPVVFFLNRLREGVTADQYEHWVREVDYPKARSLKSIESYVVNRIDGTLEGGLAPYHYIERVEVTNLTDYQHELEEGEGMEEFSRQWSEHIAESVAVHGEEIV
jgi:hypothetical protein